jgi:sarcosine oxidase delta subunit
MYKRHDIKNTISGSTIYDEERINNNWVRQDKNWLEYFKWIRQNNKGMNKENWMHSYRKNLRIFLLIV